MSQQPAVKPILRLTFGQDTFDVVRLMASEVAKIRAWTGCASKNAWILALGQDNIDAFIAGYTLMRQRRGDDIRFSDVDFDTDEMSVSMVEASSDREIEPVIVVDDNDEPVLNAKGEQQVVKAGGEMCWRYVDDKQPVPPTPPA